MVRSAQVAGKSKNSPHNVSQTIKLNNMHDAYQRILSRTIQIATQTRGRRASLLLLDADGAEIDERD
jgi:hypothetical protein